MLDAPDADLQWFLMSLCSPNPDRPYVGEVLATVHGLTNDEALERSATTGADPISSWPAFGQRVRP